MLIDCETCRAPATACGDCVMTVLLQVRPRAEPEVGRRSSVDLDPQERGALEALAGAGLVPPLRLVVGVASDFDTQSAPEPAPLDTSDFGTSARDEVLDVDRVRSAGGPQTRGIA